MTFDRCPHCRAAVALGTAWCTLCYADLRTVLAPGTARQPGPAPAGAPAVGTAIATAPATDISTVAGAGAGADPAHGRDQASWPCGRCGAGVDMRADVCPGCGAGFLAELADTPELTLSLPGIGVVSTHTRRGRFTLAAGVAVTVTVALVLVGLVLMTVL